VGDVRTLSLDVIWRDLRNAVRTLRATPAFTAVALTVLTLSIGASTAIFSVVDAVVLRGLPFAESDRLVAVGEQLIDDAAAAVYSPFRNRVAPQNFFDWREQQDVFTGLAAVNFGEITLQRDGDALPEHLRAPMVTADFVPVLRARPLLGRTFIIDDEAPGSARVAVISHALWQRRFDGRSDVIGSYLPGQQVSFEIIGVMPPGFAYPVDEADPVDAWVPYIADPQDRVRGNIFGYNLQVFGRLRDGISIARAQARMDQITAALAAETPRWFTDRKARVEPLHQFVTGGVRTWMLLLLGAVAIVMLIACVNLANLMLVRGTTRVRELGLRAARRATRGVQGREVLRERPRQEV
jgi:putative ABC transport system permease protein